MAAAMATHRGIAINRQVPGPDSRHEASRLAIDLPERFSGLNILEKVQDVGTVLLGFLKGRPVSTVVQHHQPRIFDVI